MVIRKFGGTSIGTPGRMKEVKCIVNDGSQQIIVLSAISGITNWLEKISSHLMEKNNALAMEEIDKMASHYIVFAEQLYSSTLILEMALAFIETRKNYLLGFTNKMFNTLQEKALLADGELVSTQLFLLYLQEQNLDSQLLSALSYMRIDKNLEPDEFYIRENINREIAKFPDCNVFVTQGYICRNAYGEVDNLKRGGSDYSATLIGAATQAQAVEIWTDIDGIHNNDPRIVDQTQPIQQLSFDEAAELAYFGAKILHPTSLLPAKKQGITVYLKNTLAPNLQGTVINNMITSEGIKAVAAKDNITVIRIRSGRMLNAYGFLRKVFEVFEIYKTSIDMITTSEVAISVTIDNNLYLEPIVQDLRHFCDVDYELNQSIISIVGIMKTSKKGYAAHVFHALKSIPIKMISYGASDYNISLLIEASNKNEALKALQIEFFTNH